LPPPASARERRAPGCKGAASGDAQKDQPRLHGLLAAAARPNGFAGGRGLFEASARRQAALAPCFAGSTFPRWTSPTCAAGEYSPSGRAAALPCGRYLMLFVKPDYIAQGDQELPVRSCVPPIVLFARERLKLRPLRFEFDPQHLIYRPSERGGYEVRDDDLNSLVRSGDPHWESKAVGFAFDLCLDFLKWHRIALLVSHKRAYHFSDAA